MTLNKNNERTMHYVRVFVYNKQIESKYMCDSILI